MASFIPAKRPMERIAPSEIPLTLAQLQSYVGGFVQFVDLSCGDIMVVNEAGPAFAILNHTANDLAGPAGPIYGDVVLCSPPEIA